MCPFQMVLHQNPQIPWEDLSALPSLAHCGAGLSASTPSVFHKNCTLLLYKFAMAIISSFFTTGLGSLFFPFHSRSFSKAFILWLEIQSFWKLPFLCKKSPSLARVRNFYKSSFISWLPGTKGAFWSQPLLRWWTGPLASPQLHCLWIILMCCFRAPEPTC